MQELTKFEIDTHNIIINQVLYDEEGAFPMIIQIHAYKCTHVQWPCPLSFMEKPNYELVTPVGVESKLLKARMRMQKKYIDQFYMLYDDFNITKLPLLPEEVNLHSI